MSASVNPDGIPGANIDPDGIIDAATAIDKVAATIDTKTSDISTDWAGMAAVYSTPDASTLLALMAPVSGDGDASATALSTVATALRAFAEDVRPIKVALDGLRVRAQNFVRDEVNNTQRTIPWDQDLGAVLDNNDIINQINDQVEALMAAERRCANTIRALYGAEALHAITTENDPLGYGFDDLSGAKELPWGTPTDHLEGCAGQTATFVFKDFLWEGICVGGVWGTVQGLGTLALGYNPNDGSWFKPETYGAAWSQVGQIALGGALWSNPVNLAMWGSDLAAGAVFGHGFLPESATALRDSSGAALINAGKGMIAWDQWADDPGTALGTSVFNVGTLLIPGGGEAVAGVKGLGGAARVMGTVGRVLETLDASAWAAKGLGAFAGTTVKGLSSAFAKFDFAKFGTSIPDVHVDDFVNTTVDVDGVTVKADPSGVDATVPHGEYSPPKDGPSTLSDSPQSHTDGDTSTPHADNDPGTGHHDGASGPDHGDTGASSQTHPDGHDDASDAMAAERPADVQQTPDPHHLGYADDGHPLLEDRHDGRLHYQLDPQGTFRDIDQRLHDSHGFAVDPYAGHTYPFDDLADSSPHTIHSVQDPSGWADQVADWSRVRSEPQAILAEIHTHAEEMGIDPTGKTPKQIAAEAREISQTNPALLDEFERLDELTNAQYEARQNLTNYSEAMGESAALDVARSHGDTVVIQGPAGANRLDVVSLGQGSDGYCLHVFEAKGGDSPSLGGRNTADHRFAQQGSASYLADLVSGRNTDPRLTELVRQWQSDPASADLVSRLRGDGIPVTYDLVNARTDGTVRLSHFGLGETFRLHLGPHGLEVIR